MKPTIIIDFNGALLKSEPFEEAHKRWFATMAHLLNDPTINEYATLENYFPKLQEVMQKLLGNSNKQTQIKFARHFFAMLTVAEIKQEHVIKEFAEYLRTIKEKYNIILITSAPEIAVEPILEKTGCADIFDEVYKSPMKQQPNKKELLKEYARDHKPTFYIGQGDKDITTCKELNIPTISVNWVKKAEIKGEHDIQKVEQLKEIL